jgi:hypothetical protein
MDHRGEELGQMHTSKLYSLFQVKFTSLLLQMMLLLDIITSFTCVLDGCHYRDTDPSILPSVSNVYPSRVVSLSECDTMP